MLLRSLNGPSVLVGCNVHDGSSMCESSRRMSRIVLSVWRLGKYTAFLCPATCHRQSTCRAPRNAPNTERRVQNLKGYSLVLHV